MLLTWNLNLEIVLGSKGKAADKHPLGFVALAKEPQYPNASEWWHRVTGNLVRVGESVGETPVWQVRAITTASWEGSGLPCSSAEAGEP